MIGIGFSLLGGYKIKTGVEQSGDFTSECFHAKGGCMPITLGFKFQAPGNKLVPYMYIMPGIFIPIGVHTNYTWKDDLNEKY